MQDAFETAGVWEQLTKNIEASEYTRAGDLLKIDCGYQPNGIIRLFHAVSLASEPDSAKILAFTYPALAEGIAKAKGAKTDFTAVVENEIDRQNKAVQFAIETLERTSIHVSPVSELPALAERARVELRM
jgi:methionine aminopeptidase